MEDGSVQDTVTVNEPYLDVMVIDWDDLEIDTDAARDLLKDIADLGDAENVEAIRIRLNKIIDDDEECCSHCGDPDCIGECLDDDDDEDEDDDDDEHHDEVLEDDDEEEVTGTQYTD